MAIEYTDTRGKGKTITPIRVFREGGVQEEGDEDD
jgi:hypothetical protein